MNKGRLLDRSFGTFFDSLPVSLVLLDRRGGILAANRKFQALVGQNPDDILNHNIVDFVAPVVAGEGKNLFRKMVDSTHHRTEIEILIVGENISPKRVIFNASLVSNREGETECVLAVFSELLSQGYPPHIESGVTSAFGEGEQNWSVLDELPFPLVLVDDQYRIENINRSGGKLFGTEQYSLLGSPVTTLFQELDPEEFLRGANRPQTTGGLDTDSRFAEMLVSIKGGGRSLVKIIANEVRVDNRDLWALSIHSPDRLEEPGGSVAPLVKDSFDKYDTLTGLSSQTLFIDRLQHAIHNAERSKTQLAVIFLDIDHFQHINDSFGRQGGDEILRLIAMRIVNQLRKSDTVSRFGGDKYVVLLESLKVAQHTTVVLENLRKAMSSSLNWQGNDFFVSASIGVALYPADSENEEQLLGYAEHAMVRAKESGRNTFCYYSPSINIDARLRLTMIAELHRAIEQSEFILYYQPQMDIDGKTVVGSEALLRWQHPKRGLIPPLEFLPLLEDTGLIVEVGQWVIQSAFHRLRDLKQRGVSSMRVAVNVSARQFLDRSLVKIIKKYLDESDVNPETIEFEITESALIADVSEGASMMADLASLGVGLSIDDFGTGYSSLSYLKKLPMHALKIDRSFVSGIPADQNDIRISGAVVALATNMGLTVTAEGIETHEQMNFFQSQGCDQLQGYLFAQPMAVKDFDRWMATRQ